MPAAMTLSWLLYDFGQRSASIENAEQLLQAAAATQDATVQTLFLGALQAFYSAQATRAAVSSALQAERSARESFQAAEARYKVGGRHAGRPPAGTDGSFSGHAAIASGPRARRRNALGSLANALGFNAQQAIALAEPPALPAGRRLSRKRSMR